MPTIDALPIAVNDAGSGCPPGKMGIVASQPLVKAKRHAVIYIAPFQTTSPLAWDTSGTVVSGPATSDAPSA